MTTRVTMVQFALRANERFDMENVRTTLAANPTSAIWFCSASGKTGFTSKDTNYVLNVVDDKVVMRQYSKKPTHFVHVKALVSFNKASSVVGKADIKINETGNVQVTLSYPEEGKVESLEHVMGLIKHGVQKYVKKVLKTELNLVNANMYWKMGHGGSFDLEQLLGVYRESGYDAVLSNSDTEELTGSTRIHITKDDVASGLLHRKGSFQMRIKKPDMSRLSSYLSWGKNVLRVLGGEKGRETYDDEPDFFECNGNPIPSPRDYETGTCPENYAIVPNKRGDPCCKKIPKSKASFKKSLVGAYAKHRIPVPQSIAMITEAERQQSRAKWAKVSSPTTGCVIKTSNRPARSRVVRVSGDFSSGLMVDAKICSKYSAKDIKELAKSVGIDVKPLRTKEKICRKIDELSRQGYASLRREGIDANSAIGQNTRNAEAREQRNNALLDSFLRQFDPDLCRKGTKRRGVYDKDQIKTFARVLGLRNVSKLSKEEMCKRIREKAQLLRQERSIAT